METKFQTSFIPKKPLPMPGAPTVGMNFGQQVQRRHGGGTSIFMNLAILLFIVSLGVAGGMYAWKDVSLTTQNDLKQQLADREQQFNPDLIEVLKRINVEIDTAKRLLNNHLAISNVFDIISRLTAEKVRFTGLNLTSAGQSGGVKISMKGYGVNLSTVAFQSDVLGQLDQYGLRKIVKNPILANPTIGSDGTVAFDFSASIDPSTLSYKNSLTGATTTSP